MKYKNVRWESLSLTEFICYFEDCVNDGSIPSAALANCVERLDEMAFRLEAIREIAEEVENE